MKTQAAINKQETEASAQVEIEQQSSPESTGSEYSSAFLNRVSMPPAGDPSADHHATLVQRAYKSNPAYSQQLFHHLQRTHGNRYVQRVVELSRKGHEPAEVDQDIEQSIQSKRGGGHAMDNNARRQMEDGFGQDFSSVRIHTDSDADGLNKNLNARAFTTGSDVFFRGGEYRPGSSSGRELLAHELTHVVQQGGSGKVQRLCEGCEEEQANEGVAGIQTKLTLGQPNDKYEQEADDVAQRIMRQEHHGSNERQEGKNTTNIQVKTSHLARQEEDQDELQLKSDANVMHRQEKKKDELQLKSDSIQGKEFNHSANNQLNNSGGDLQTPALSERLQSVSDVVSTASVINTSATRSTGNASQGMFASTTATTSAAEDLTTPDQLETQNAEIAAPVQPVTSSISSDSAEQPAEDQKVNFSEQQTIANAMEASNEAQASREPEFNKSVSIESTADEIPTDQVRKIVSTVPETKVGITGDGDAKDVKEADAAANDLEKEAQKEDKEEKEEEKAGPEVKELMIEESDVKGTEPQTGIHGEDAVIGAEGGEGQPVAVAISAESTAPTAMAILNDAVANTTLIATSPVQFAAQNDLESSNPKERQRRNASETAAGGFISRVGQQISRFASKGMQAVPRIIDTTNQSKSNIEATVTAEIEAVSAHSETERGQTKRQAGISYGLVARKLEDTKSAIVASAKKARSDSKTAHDKAKGAVTKRASSEVGTINKHYTAWEPKFRAEGSKAGTKAKLSGNKSAINWLSQQNGKSSILDGPVHDNKLKARAKAARQVSKEYDKSLKKSANEQADKIPKSKPGVITKVGEVLTQVHVGLEKQLKSFTGSIDSSERKGLAQADKTAKSMRSAIYSSLKKTLGSLDQQESVQITRLANYGEAQKQSIDGIASQTISTVADGVSLATDALNQSMGDFKASAATMAAPDRDGLSKELGGVEAQTNLQASSMMQRLDEGVQAGQTGINTGGMESSEALRQLSSSAQQQATTSSVAYAESSKKLRSQASSGFGQLKAGSTKTAQQMAANAIKGFKESEKASDKAFNEFGKSVEDNFTTNSKALGDSLWSQQVQGEHAANVQKYAGEAASKVKPRWKSVLKWVITIVVIIAVVAITILSAGSLGPVGIVLLGATLGAMAGAATQIGHNLVDGEKWHKGVGKAMIVGGIGGAFGGLGGVLFKSVGSVALKIGLEAGLDVVGGVVGEVSGSLAVGESISLSGVVVGALIGAGIGAGLGIGGALKGKFKAKFAGPDVSVPTTKPVVEAPVSAPKPAGKVRGFLEKIKVLEPSAPTAGRPRGSGLEAPTGKPATEAPSTTKPAEPEVPTTKAAAQEAPGGKHAEPSAGPARKSHIDEPEIEDGVVAKQSTPDGHEVKVLKDGRVVRCSTCEELRIKYGDDPAIVQKIDEIEAITDPNLKAEKAAALSAELESGRPDLGGASASRGPSDELAEITERLKNPRELSGKVKKQLRARKKELQKQIQADKPAGQVDEPLAQEDVVPTEFKQRKSGLTGKEAATDIPSWAKERSDARPGVNENGVDFATRMMNKKYGAASWERTGLQGVEFSQLKKFGDRAFE